MKTSLRTVVLGAALALVGAFPAAAQELSLGYQLQWNDSVGESRTYPFGFNVDVAFPINSAGTLAAFGQFDWSNRGENDDQFGSNLLFYGGGVRWKPSTMSSIEPYAHFALGASRLAIPDADFDATTSFALQLGGGVAGPLTQRIDWLLQFDYRPIFTEDESSYGIRLVGGVRIPFGGQ